MSRPTRRGASIVLLVLAATLTLTGCGPTNGVDAAGTPVPTAGASSPTPSPSASNVGFTQSPQLAACPMLSSAPPVPHAMPDLTLDCLGVGPAVNLAHLRGLPTVVNVWASWCGPCRTETPALEAAHRVLGSKVRFIGVDISDDATAAQQFLLADHVTYPSVYDPNDTVRAPLLILGPPVTFLVGANGHIVKRLDGGITTSSDILKQIDLVFGMNP